MSIFVGKHILIILDKITNSSESDQYSEINEMAKPDWKKIEKCFSNLLHFQEGDYEDKD